MEEGRCIRCGKEKRWLHEVRQPRIPAKCQRLCSSCVLLCYGGMFCAFCFEDCGELPDTIKCSKCPRSAHLRCERQRSGDNSSSSSLSSSSSSSSSFVCPYCLNPSFNPFSGFGANGNANAKARGEAFGVSKHMPDGASAKLLLTAARISCVCNKRAASAANFEASKRAREAVTMRKEAREAFDRALCVAMEEEVKRQTGAAAAAAQPQARANEDKVDFGKFVAGSLGSVPLQTATVAGGPNG